MTREREFLLQAAWCCPPITWSAAGKPAKGWANDKDNPRRSGDALALAIKDSRNRLLFQSQAPSAPTAPITFLLTRSPFWVIANTAAIARQRTTSCYHSGLGPISSRLFRGRQPQTARGINIL